MAWERVTPEIITNCFPHTGLISNEISEEAVDVQDAAVVLQDDLDLNEQKTTVILQQLVQKKIVLIQST